MAKKQFKAESKRLLELMIHSIYTNKEIFLRELISNASDATDKRYYENSQSGGEALNRGELPITIAVDKENRKLSITDNGCGMTEKELETNLGTIAKSGSLEFKENTKDDTEVDIIGQFGVGFYSAFMVADSVEVCTRPQSSDTAARWVSNGTDGYTIETCEKPEPGTTITLTIKPDTDDDNYSKFLDEWHIQNLVKKYSDYIRYPIVMNVEKERTIEGEPTEKETYYELETLNSMTPIWKKRRSEVSDEEYNEFYKNKFFDYQDPLKVIYTNTEGVSTYEALLFIPKTMPMNYMSKDYKKGLQLYASGVLIMEHCADLLPDYFAFVRGIVDSQDLSLNISRELLQQDAQLRFISGRLEKKIQSELLAMLRDEREKYIEMFNNFGLSIKYGIYESFGAKKDFLQDLLIFDSSLGEKTTLSEYVSRMREDQKYIYYASGENLEQASSLPAVRTVLDKGYEIIYLTEQIDEFVIKILAKYEDKDFRSINSGDLGIETKEEKEALEKQTESSKDLINFIKETLGNKVVSVELSGRSGEYPACITAKGELSLEMEKVLSSMPGSAPIKAERVLELNPENPVFKTMSSLLGSDDNRLKSYITILYNQALLLEGMSVENLSEYSKAVNDILA